MVVVAETPTQLLKELRTPKRGDFFYFLKLSDMNELQKTASTVEAEAEKRTKTYEEKTEELLNELYGWNWAERTKSLPISKQTHAALYVKGLTQDLLSALYSLHEIIWGEVDSVTGGKFAEAIRPIEEIVNSHLIDAIDVNMGSRDYKEI